MRRWRCGVCGSILDLTDEEGERKVAVRCTGMPLQGPLEYGRGYGHSLSSGPEALLKYHWPIVMEEIPWIEELTGIERGREIIRARVENVKGASTGTGTKNVQWDGEDWRQDIG